MQLEVFKLHWKALNVDKNPYGTSMMPSRFAEIQISGDTIKKYKLVLHDLHLSPTKSQR